MMKPLVTTLLLFPSVCIGFVPSQLSLKKHDQRTLTSYLYSTTSTVASDVEIKRRKQKEAILGLLGGQAQTTSNSNSTSQDGTIGYDPVLADPQTKLPLKASLVGPMLGGVSTGVRVSLTSSPESDRVFKGRTDTYLNLLEPTKPSSSDNNKDPAEEARVVARAALASLTPPLLRSALSSAGLFSSEDGENEYIPMRDLFTSPSVSFAYERGWRQNFAVAGFPGPDKEYEMVKDYFLPAVVGKDETTVVDMSCATGLFTRRLAKSNDYTRVIGCDYSDAMLTEARRRIRADPTLSNKRPSSSAFTPTTTTQLDLVRCDVGQIPMQSSSIDALHAGAAMHCWPDIPSAVSEIHRVLKPEGRFFATTFLGTYFQGLQNVESRQMVKTMQSFQYFESVDELRQYMLDAGFEKEKVDIEVLGRACVVIRCEK